MMRYLVTGAAGFIGAATSEALIERDDIIGIDNFNDCYQPQLKRDRVTRVTTSAQGRFESRQVDFADRTALARAVLWRRLKCAVLGR